MQTIALADMMTLAIEVASENAIICYLNKRDNETDITDQDIYRAIVALSEEVNLSLKGQVIELVPAFRSLLVVFDINKLTIESITSSIEKLFKQSHLHPESSIKSIDIPVYYGEEVSQDLDYVARQTGLQKEQVIELHMQTDYYVQAIGFAPGFSYLGNLDPRIVLPRRQTPRTQVPKGAVAIANDKTAIYPNSMPGGWHIIGSTPFDLFDKDRNPPMLLQVGDKVRFKKINKADFVAQGGVL
ncbi:5-oxoprolinase subunit PxpB [Thalassotalea ganghwensis]